MTVRELHDKAMRLAQQASMHGELDQARSVAAEALVLERQAAELVENERSSEPTRSILYLSAASLALQAGQYDDMRQLAREGLAGFPMARTIAELNTLLEIAKETTP